MRKWERPKWCQKISVGFICMCDALNIVPHVSIAVVDLLQELTDIDTLHESEEGAEVLIDSLVSLSSKSG